MNKNELHVIFGAGPLGANLAASLLNEGKKVRLVTRSGKSPIGAWPELEVLSADASLPDEAARAANSASVIYNCTNAPYEKWLTMLRPLFEGILSAAERVGAPLVVADNLYGYGQVRGPIREDLPLSATSPKCRLRAQLAEEMLEEHSRGKVQVAILQGSDFFGPHAVNAHMGTRAFEPILRGRTVWVVGDPSLPHAWTYVPDFVEALKRVGASSQGFGRRWIVPSHSQLSAQDFVAKAAALAGTSSKAMGIPRGVLYAAGWVMPMMRELRETLYQFEAPFTVDASDFESTFGMEATPIDDAIRATLRWVSAGRDESTSAVHAAIHAS